MIEVHGNGHGIGKQIHLHGVDWIIVIYNLGSAWKRTTPVTHLAVRADATFPAQTYVIFEPAEKELEPEVQSFCGRCGAELEAPTDEDLACDTCRHELAKKWLAKLSKDSK